MGRATKVAVFVSAVAIFTGFSASIVWGLHPCSEVMTYIDGKEVYSNGSDQGTKDSCVTKMQISPPLSPYGLQYQCTELVDRYFGRNLANTFGRDYFLNAPGNGLIPFRNGESKILPKHGDAVGFDNRTQLTPDGVGHVALVDTVSQNADGTYIVGVVEQNWSGVKEGRDHLTMFKDAQGRYRIESRASDTFVTQGWMRKYPFSVPPGMYADGWHNDTSYLFLESYELRGGASVLGASDTRTGEIPYVHQWCVQTACVTLQDFFGGTMGDLALILNTWTNKAHLVRTAFWEYYRTNSGPVELGAPLEEEHAPISNQTHFHPCPQEMWACQGFERGSLMWDGTQVSGMSHIPPMPPTGLRVR